MSDIATLPVAPAYSAPRYDCRLLGKRARHRSLDIDGRLTGDYRSERGVLWLCVDTNSGRYWWAEGNIELLGPVPMGGEDRL